MDAFLISFDATKNTSNADKWKTVNADILKVVYKSLIGVGVSNCNKADLIAAILPKLTERRLLGISSLLPEKVTQEEEQVIRADNVMNEDFDEI